MDNMGQTKTDHPSFNRDSDSKALVNTDHTALTAYKRRKNLVRQQNARINNLEVKVDGMQASLNEILKILRGA